MFFFIHTFLKKTTKMYLETRKSASRFTKCSETLWVKECKHVKNMLNLAQMAWECLLKNTSVQSLSLTNASEVSIASNRTIDWTPKLKGIVRGV